MFPDSSDHHQARTLWQALHLVAKKHRQQGCLNSRTFSCSLFIPFCFLMVPLIFKTGLLPSVNMWICSYRHTQRYILSISQTLLLPTRLMRLTIRECMSPYSTGGQPTILPKMSSVFRRVMFSQSIPNLVSSFNEFLPSAVSVIELILALESTEST